MVKSIILLLFHLSQFIKKFGKWSEWRILDKDRTPGSSYKYIINLLIVA